MLTFEQIKELVELVATRGLHGMEVERSGFRLKIEGQAPVVSQVASAAPSSYAVSSPAEPGATPVANVHLPATGVGASAPAAPSGPADHVLTSPIVGTFYSASSPEAPPFVSVGSKVKKGQVLCIIEAMKLMNEIESDVNGEITQIHSQNAQAVEFGQPLFSIRAS